jgi:hypothetical protein
LFNPNKKSLLNSLLAPLFKRRLIGVKSFEPKANNSFAAGGIGWAVPKNFNKICVVQKWPKVLEDYFIFAKSTVAGARGFI